MQARSIPLDALRGLAVLFMLEVHLGFWWSRHLPGGDPLVALGTSLGGMAAPLFFTVAGAGLSISRAQRPAGFRQANIRRGAALLAAGVVFTLIERAVYGPWGWGVLQSLGVSIIICTLAMVTGPAARAAGGFALMAVAPVLRHLAGIPDVLYSDSLMSVSSPAGYLDSALLSGFFPLVPWTGFMLLGTVAGELSRADPTDSAGEAARAGKGPWHLAILAAFMLAFGGAGAAGGMPMEFFPPSLPFCLLASGLCIAAIAAAGALTRTSRAPKRAGPLALAGRLSLTFFVVHHFIGYEAFSAAGLLRSLDTSVALAMVLASWALAIAAAAAWSRTAFRFSLEWLLGRLCGRPSK
jgi:uncharacterized membrane protein